jgi:acyl carrier protein
MANLLTTKGIGFFIDELFKKSEEYIYIVTPYFKVDAVLEERITDALDNGIKIILIYGKDVNQLKKLKCASRIETYFYENLHAKFYINEKSILITSMNMHAFSEANNREIGVLFSKNDRADKNIIDDCIKEFESIKKQSKSYSNPLVKSVSNESKNNSTINRNNESVYRSKYFPIIKEIIIDKLGVHESEIRPEASYTYDLGADSLDLVELVMDIEREFNISIPDNEAEKIITISQTIEYLEAKNIELDFPQNGHCIRTGIEIPFNIEKPLCFNAFKMWNEFGDPDYPERFCHFSGEPSNGATSVNRPILKKNWKKAKETFDL